MERLRYRDEIFAAGFEAVRALGPFHYASLHFRSGDFQMSKIASAEKIAARVSTIVGDKQLLYVATDHRDKKALRKAFAKHGVNIVLWEDLGHAEGSRLGRGLSASTEPHVAYPVGEVGRDDRASDLRGGRALRRLGAVNFHRRHKSDAALQRRSGSGLARAQSLAEPRCARR